MVTAVKLLEDEKVFAHDMSRYLAELREQKNISQEQAYKNAKSALQRTGVITSGGRTKKKIVSWE